MTTKTPAPVALHLPEYVSDASKAAIHDGLSRAWQAGRAWGKAEAVSEAATAARLKVACDMVRRPPWPSG